MGRTTPYVSSGNGLSRDAPEPRLNASAWGLAKPLCYASRAVISSHLQGKDRRVACDDERLTDTSGEFGTM
jgi:hypothetical protein